MNYQKKPPPDVVNILEKNNVQFYDMNYYAYPQTFGSTNGPNVNAIGMDAMTTFTVEAWVCNETGPTVYVCGNMYHFSTSHFHPFQPIYNWDIL